MILGNGECWLLSQIWSHPRERLRQAMPAPTIAILAAQVSAEKFCDLIASSPALSLYVLRILAVAVSGAELQVQ